MAIPLHVLIVEDSEDDTLLSVRELRHGGYDVVFERVETAEAMTDALDNRQWDIVIADFTMPHFNGMDALRLLREKGFDIPFIFVSGTIGEDRAVAAMKNGANDYIIKGNLKRLIPAIERELREAEVRLKRRQAEETIRHMAYFDPLTELPNKTNLYQIISKTKAASEAHKEPFALLLLDIDRFRDINNSLGYHQGDELLKEIGSRLKETLKHGEELARFGADEFAILIPGADSERATDAAKEILNVMDAPFETSGLNLYIQASIGIALFPGHGSEADLLIRHAEIAMFQAKKKGSGYSVYVLEFEQGASRRLALAGDLRHAIENSGLLLYCQPKVDIKTGRISGAEALLRWEHPAEGMISPNEFIPIAEHTGLIKPLTYWVLDASIRQCFAWQEQRFSVPLSVNLSVRNLHDPRLMDKISGLISTWGIAPGGLEVDLTESAFTDEPAVYNTLTHIRNMGINIFIDDFGTGYSSLSYLQKLPVNAIKIDKSFVFGMTKDKNSANIVNSTIGLAHSMNLKVIAEGVENKEVYDNLSELGCNEAQGYYISKPMPAEQFTDWAEKSSWKKRV
ncbi:MAG: EAL domain-containing protein [Deltaproteobacteria bacterium]|nr:EAL domain-containing protein [Deltaproteobacteria bacterium]